MTETLMEKTLKVILKATEFKKQDESDQPDQFVANLSPQFSVGLT